LKAEIDFWPLITGLWFEFLFSAFLFQLLVLIYVQPA